MFMLMSSSKEFLLKPLKVLCLSIEVHYLFGSSTQMQTDALAKLELHPPSNTARQLSNPFVCHEVLMSLLRPYLCLKAN